MINFKFWERVKFINKKLLFETCGLVKTGLPEIRVEVVDNSLLSGAKELLKYVVKYQNQSGNIIHKNETMYYGLWLIKFIQISDNLLEIWEYNEDTSDFVLGGSSAVNYWIKQHKICRKYNSIFAPPKFDSLTAISAGVLEGNPVHAMRYPWPDHMSGWLIVTDEYNGDVETLTNHHTHHIISLRPDISPFVSLSPGYGFDLRDKTHVWYDEDSVNEHMAEYFNETS